MYKCYACGREVNDTEELCPYCRFPVISTIHGDKVEDEEIRKFAEEYRKMNPEYFSKRSVLRASSSQKPVSEKKLSRESVSEEKPASDAEPRERTPLEQVVHEKAGTGEKEVSQISQVVKPKKNHRLAWILCAAVLIFAELYILYAYAVRTGTMPNIPPVSITAGKAFFEGWYRGVSHFTSNSAIRNILDYLAGTRDAYFFAVVSVVLGLIALLLGIAAKRAQKTAQKVIFHVLFWIFFIAYLLLMLSAPVYIMYYYRKVSFYAYAVSAVVHTVLLVLIIREIIAQIRRLLLHK